MQSADTVPGILIFSLDRLGASWLGPYGNTWIETPEINRLAAESVLVENCYAQSLDGGLAALLETALAEHAPQLAIIGEHAAGSSANESAAKRINLSLGELAVQPANDVAETHLFRYLAAARDAMSTAAKSSKVVLLACDSLGKTWDAPLAFRNQFALEDDPLPMDFVDPPSLRLPPQFDPDELLSLHHVYAGQVSLLDLVLGALLDDLREDPVFKNWLIIFTSPRGYALGEHGGVGAGDAGGDALYAETLQVPLFIRHPQGKLALHRHLPLTTHADVARYVARIANGSSDDWLAFAASQHVKQSVVSRSGESWSLRTPAWFFRCDSLESDACELFAKPDDRWELNEVASRCGEVAEQARQFVKMLRDQHPQCLKMLQFPPEVWSQLPDELCDAWH